MTPGDSPTRPLFGRFLSLPWAAVVWGLNTLFLAVTIVYPYVPDNRRGSGILLALGSFQFEKNFATFWEGLCLLLVALLAWQRYLEAGDAPSPERHSWLGLALLAAGLSLDELGSLHERAKYVFSPWTGSDGMINLVPLAVPAVLILGFTLERMLRLADRRRFWLTFVACGVLGSVVVQEKLEHAVHWPSWFEGFRYGIEEGTELFGIFLLLAVVVRGASPGNGRIRAAALLPSGEALRGMRGGVTILTLLGALPLALVTVMTLEVTENRGIPSAWIPFVLLSMAAIAAWRRSERNATGARRYAVIAAVAFFFALDQIIVFQRVVDMQLIRGRVEVLAFPLLAVLCLAVPALRTGRNMILAGALLLLTPLLAFPWETVPRLVLPLQCLGIFRLLVAAYDQDRIGGT